LGIVEEEADESAFWLELIIESALLQGKLVQPLLDEANELTRIVASSRMTARNRLKNGTTAAVESNRQSAIGNRQ
jgi:hypothetical protein